MTKIAINRCFGGFCLSTEAVEALAARRGHPQVWWFRLGSSTDGFIPITDGSQEGGRDYAFTSPEPDWETDAWIEMRPDVYDRADPELISVIEELGSERASARSSSLQIVEIPDEVEWTIVDYDGREHVAEKHRTWS